LDFNNCAYPCVHFWLTEDPVGSGAGVFIFHINWTILDSIAFWPAQVIFISAIINTLKKTTGSPSAVHLKVV
jgi:hypothetical protein